MKVPACVAAALAVCATASAAPAPGTPPPGMSPIGSSLYTAQFALCSLDTLAGLGRQQGLAVGNLTPRAAAGRLAEARDGDLGSAAVRGCRAGLLYRLRTDRTAAGLRTDLSQRITAEKYVAAVYGLILVAFLAYVIIHAAKVSRLRDELEAFQSSPRPATRAER